MLCCGVVSFDRGRYNIIRHRYWRKIVSNLRYGDGSAMCGKSPQEINNTVHKVHYAGRIRLLKLNARETKLMVVCEENTNALIYSR